MTGGRRPTRAATFARWLLALAVAALVVGAGWCLAGGGCGWPDDDGRGGVGERHDGGRGGVGGRDDDGRGVGGEADALRGVTLERLVRADRAVGFLEQLPGRETVRVVLEPGRPLSDYAPLVRELATHVDVLLQLADSSELAELTADELGERTHAAVELLGAHVAIWEIGNEPNGDWAGTSPQEIAGKVNVAAEIVRTAGGKTAVTFNYWDRPDCYREGWEDPLTFAPFLNFEPDYVFLSVYESACVPPQHPDAAGLGDALTRLGERYPRALLGIGEIGAQGTEDGQPEPNIAEKERVARYYHGLDSELREIVGERYVGGYFWWYFARDVLDAPSGHFWETLREELGGVGPGR